MNEFKRGGNPLERIDAGGFSYDTLKSGAIIQSKRFFGITQSSGNIAGYHGAKISVRREDYFLVTDLNRPAHGKITFNFIKSRDEAKLMEVREVIKIGGKANFFMACRGYLCQLTKRRFDYRFDIIERGFHESEIRK